MSYFGQTFAYLKKSFWLPTVAMLVPSVVACFLSTPYWEVAFVAAFDYEPYISVAGTFNILFGDSWTYLWPVVLVGATQVIGAAIVMSAIDRHFRTGRLSLRDPLRLMNNSVFPLAVGVTLMSVMSIIWRVLLFGLVILIQAVSSAAGLPSGAALAMISAVAVVLFMLHVLIITPMLYWSPIMFIYGYKFRDAAATSFKLISGKKVFASLIIPTLLCAGVQLLVGMLDPHASIKYVAGFFLILFTNVYVTTYTMLTFYAISGLARRDLKSYRIMPLPPIPAVKPEQRADKAASAGASTPANGENKQKPEAEKQTKKSNAKQTVKPEAKKPATKTKTAVRKAVDDGTEGGNGV